MIIVGYQGIGKSTLAHNNINYIDLESSDFYVGTKRVDDWYKPYCKIAEHLSQQGYYVFVSSHAIVRAELKNSSEPVMCCAPTLELKEFWIDKLRGRFITTQSRKDYAAWKNAEKDYEANIKDIENSGFPMIWIDSPEYVLSLKINEAESNAKEGKI